MDEEDQDDIIKKVKMSGAADDEGDEPESDFEEPAEDGFGEDPAPEDEEVGFGDAELEEGVDLPDLIHNPDDFDVNDVKRYYDAMVTRERDGLTGRVVRFDDGRLKVKITDGPHSGKIYYAYPSEISMNESLSEEDTLDINLKNMKQDAEDILSMDKEVRDDKLKGHKWADDHISTSADDAEEVADFLTNEGDNPCWDGYERVPGTKEGEKGSCKKKTSESINEAEYKGKKVTLNKPTKGDVKKFKVYVKNDKGNVIKVNFGDPNMEIRRDNAEAKKSFRARHKCSEKKDKTTAGYWSCKMWSNKKVSDITENLNNSSKSTIFVENMDMKDVIKSRLNEMSEPAPVKPDVKPDVAPKKPSRRIKRIWETKPVVKPKPKMKGMNTQVYELNGKAVDSGSLEVDGVDTADYPDFTDAYISYGLFMDGTEMSDEELDAFANEYPEVVGEMAFEKFM